MKLYLFLLLQSLLWMPLLAQQTPKGLQHPNLVPNAGFETFASPPIGWYYKGLHFTKVVRYWSSATAASPDAFGPGVRVPSHWKAKDFGEQQPHTGAAMAGITVYGCDEGKPHCREYIQIQLNEPLVIGQVYHVAFWVSHLPRSIQINNLGVAFSKFPVEEKTPVLLETAPDFFTEDILVASDDQWLKVDGEVTATEEADYLIIGNFFPDSLTNTKVNCEDPLKFAYYYIDDVVVRKKEPILPVPVDEDDLSRIKIEKGQIVVLKNIFFETDRAELLPRSFVELRKLLKIMQDNPAMVIQINGHTDSMGDDSYNVALSLRRAKAVLDFLQINGIDEERMTYKGFGRSQPIASNTTNEGRQLNRRVEFLVIQK